MSEKHPARQIRISQEVYEAIAAEARPLNDSPDSVLRRKYGLPPKDERPPKEELSQAKKD